MLVMPHQLAIMVVGLGLGFPIGGVLASLAVGNYAFMWACAGIACFVLAASCRIHIY